MGVVRRLIALGGIVAAVAVAWQWNSAVDIEGELLSDPLAFPVPPSPCRVLQREGSDSHWLF